MNNAEIQAIIEAASKVKYKNWMYNKFNEAIENLDGDYLIATEANEDEAEHIANTCPSNIIPLLEELIWFRKNAGI